MRDLLALAAAAALLASPLSAREMPAGYYGVNHDFVWTADKDIPGLVAALKQSGAQAVRVPIRWTVVEPERGKWQWEKVDSVIRRLRAADIEILPVLMSVPAWASGVDPDKTEGFWDCYAPKDIADWAEFARRCVYRYRKHIRYWEIWNEQNGQDFYKPMPDAPTYVRLLKSAGEAIRREDPSATVVLGGLQMNGIIPNPWHPVKVEDFLQKIYDAGGRPHFDIVNIHPYVTTAADQGPAYCARLVRDTVDVMKRNGDAAKPLWITETGTYTGQGVTEDMQAELLRGIYRELRRIPEVKAVYWFTLRDYPAAITGGEHTMGLMAADGRRKPAFAAFQDAVKQAARPRG